MWDGHVSRLSSAGVRLLLATRNPCWRRLGQAEQALSFAIAALQGKRKWSNKGLYFKGSPNMASSEEMMAFVREPCEAEEELEGGVWSELPDEVIEMVLAWLPLPSHFRMRCVCRKWYNIMTLPGFRDAYSRVPRCLASFLHLLRVNGVLLAAFHDPTISHWQRFSLDSIPINAYIHGGGGGLICCQRVEKGALVLSVCNPLTKAWRDLPSMPHKHASTCFVKMVANIKANSYKVIRVGQLQPLPLVQTNNGPYIELCTEVFDSVTGCWATIDYTPTDLRFIQGCSVSCGALHCRTSSTRRMMDFSIKTGLWTEVMTRNLDTVLDAKMVDCDGKPYLVTRVWRVGPMESINIFGRRWQTKPAQACNFDDEVSVETDEWEEVARMPSSLFQEWSSTAGLYYHVGVGDFIYSTCLAQGSSKLVTYSLRRKKWRLIDGCPVSQSNTYLGGFEFCPRLDAAV